MLQYRYIPFCHLTSPFDFFEYSLHHNHFLLDLQLAECSTHHPPARPRTRLHGNLHLVIRCQARPVRLLSSSFLRISLFTRKYGRLNIHRARSLGATHTINYTTTPAWDDELLRLTNGKGVDHVLDVGGSATLEKSLRAVRRGGLVSCIGFLGKVSTEGNSEGVGDKVGELVMQVIGGAKMSKCLFFRCLTRSHTFLLSFAFLCPNLHCLVLLRNRPGTDLEIWVLVVHWLTENRLKTVRGIYGIYKTHCEALLKLVDQHQIHPLIAEVFDFEDAKMTFEKIMKREVVGKVVIKVKP